MDTLTKEVVMADLVVWDSCCILGYGPIVICPSPPAEELNVQSHASYYIGKDIDHYINNEDYFETDVDSGERCRRAGFIEIQVKHYSFENDVLIENSKETYQHHERDESLGMETENEEALEDIRCQLGELLAINNTDLNYSGDLSPASLDGYHMNVYDSLNPDSNANSVSNGLLSTTFDSLSDDVFETESQTDARRESLMFSLHRTKRNSNLCTENVSDNSSTSVQKSTTNSSAEGPEKACENEKSDGADDKENIAEDEMSDSPFRLKLNDEVLGQLGVKEKEVFRKLDENSYHSLESYSTDLTGSSESGSYSLPSLFDSESEVDRKEEIMIVRKSDSFEYKNNHAVQEDVKTNNDGLDRAEADTGVLEQKLEKDIIDNNSDISVGMQIAPAGVQVNVSYPEGDMTQESAVESGYENEIECKDDINVVQEPGNDKDLAVENFRESEERCNEASQFADNTCMSDAIMVESETENLIQEKKDSDIHDPIESDTSESVSVSVDLDIRVRVDLGSPRDEGNSFSVSQSNSDYETLVSELKPASEYNFSAFTRMFQDKGQKKLMDPQGMSFNAMQMESAEKIAKQIVEKVLRASQSMVAETTDKAISERTGQLMQFNDKTDKTDTGINNKIIELTENGDEKQVCSSDPQKTKPPDKVKEQQHELSLIEGKIDQTRPELEPVDNIKDHMEELSNEDKQEQNKYEHVSQSDHIATQIMAGEDETQQSNIEKSQLDHSEQQPAKADIEQVHKLEETDTEDKSQTDHCEEQSKTADIVQLKEAEQSSIEDNGMFDHREQQPILADSAQVDEKEQSNIRDNSQLDQIEEQGRKYDTYKTDRVEQSYINDRHELDHSDEQLKMPDIVQVQEVDQLYIENNKQSDFSEEQAIEDVPEHTEETKQSNIISKCQMDLSEEQPKKDNIKHAEVVEQTNIDNESQLDYSEEQLKKDDTEQAEDSSMLDHSEERGERSNIDEKCQFDCSKEQAKKDDTDLAERVCQSSIEDESQLDYNEVQPEKYETDLAEGNEQSNIEDKRQLDGDKQPMKNHTEHGEPVEQYNTEGKSDNDDSNEEQPNKDDTDQLECMEKSNIEHKSKLDHSIELLKKDDTDLAEWAAHSNIEDRGQLDHTEEQPKKVDPDLAEGMEQCNIEIDRSEEQPEEDDIDLIEGEDQKKDDTDLTEGVEQPNTEDKIQLENRQAQPGKDDTDLDDRVEQSNIEDKSQHDNSEEQSQEDDTDKVEGIEQSNIDDGSQSDHSEEQLIKDDSDLVEGVDKSDTENKSQFDHSEEQSKTDNIEQAEMVEQKTDDTDVAEGIEQYDIEDEIQLDHSKEQSKKDDTDQTDMVEPKKDDTDEAEGIEHSNIENGSQLDRSKEKVKGDSGLVEGVDQSDIEDKSQLDDIEECDAELAEGIEQSGIIDKSQFDHSEEPQNQDDTEQTEVVEPKNDDTDLAEGIKQLNIEDNSQLDNHEKHQEKNDTDQTDMAEQSCFVLDHSEEQSKIDNIEQAEMVEQKTDDTDVAEGIEQYDIEDEIQLDHSKEQPKKDDTDQTDMVEPKKDETDEAEGIEHSNIENGSQFDQSVEELNKGDSGLVEGVDESDIEDKSQLDNIEECDAELAEGIEQSDIIDKSQFDHSEEPQNQNDTEQSEEVEPKNDDTDVAEGVKQLNIEDNSQLDNHEKHPEKNDTDQTDMAEQSCFVLDHSEEHPRKDDTDLAERVEQPNIDDKCQLDHSEEQLKKDDRALAEGEEQSHKEDKSQLDFSEEQLKEDTTYQADDVESKKDDTDLAEGAEHSNIEDRGQLDHTEEQPKKVDTDLAEGMEQCNIEIDRSEEQPEKDDFDLIEGVDQKKEDTDLTEGVEQSNTEDKIQLENGQAKPVKDDNDLDERVEQSNIEDKSQHDNSEEQSQEDDTDKVEGIEQSYIDDGSQCEHSEEQLKKGDSDLVEGIDKSDIENKSQLDHSEEQSKIDNIEQAEMVEQKTDDTDVAEGVEQYDIEDKTQLDHSKEQPKKDDTDQTDMLEPKKDDTDEAVGIEHSNIENGSQLDRSEEELNKGDSGLVEGVDQSDIEDKSQLDNIEECDAELAEGIEQSDIIDKSQFDHSEEPQNQDDTEQTEVVEPKNDDTDLAEGVKQLNIEDNSQLDNHEKHPEKNDTDQTDMAEQSCFVLDHSEEHPRKDDTDLAERVEQLNIDDKCQLDHSEEQLKKDDRALVEGEEQSHKEDKSQLDFSEEQLKEDTTYQEEVVESKKDDTNLNEGIKHANIDDGSQLDHNQEQSMKDESGLVESVDQSNIEDKSQLDHSQEESKKIDNELIEGIDKNQFDYSEKQQKKDDIEQAEKVGQKNYDINLTEGVEQSNVEDTGLLNHNEEQSKKDDTDKVEVVDPSCFHIDHTKEQPKEDDTDQADMVEPKKDDTDLAEGIEHSNIENGCQLDLSEEQLNKGVNGLVRAIDQSDIESSSQLDNIEEYDTELAEGIQQSTIIDKSQFDHSEEQTRKDDTEQAKVVEPNNDDTDLTEGIKQLNIEDKRQLDNHEKQSDKDDSDQADMVENTCFVLDQSEEHPKEDDADVAERVEQSNIIDKCQLDRSDEQLKKDDMALVEGGEQSYKEDKSQLDLSEEQLKKDYSYQAVVEPKKDATDLDEGIEHSNIDDGSQLDHIQEQPNEYDGGPVERIDQSDIEDKSQLDHSEEQSKKNDNELAERLERCSMIDNNQVDKSEKQQKKVDIEQAEMVEQKNDDIEQSKKDDADLAGCVEQFHSDDICQLDHSGEQLKKDDTDLLVEDEHSNIEDKSQLDHRKQPNKSSTDLAKEVDQSNIEERSQLDQSEENPKKDDTDQEGVPEQSYIDLGHGEEQSEEDDIDLVKGVDESNIDDESQCGHSEEQQKKDDSDLAEGLDTKGKSKRGHSEDNPKRDDINLAEGENKSYVEHKCQVDHSEVQPKNDGTDQAKVLEPNNDDTNLAKGVERSDIEDKNQLDHNEEEPKKDPADLVEGVEQSNIEIKCQPDHSDDHPEKDVTDQEGVAEQSYIDLDFIEEQPKKDDAVLTTGVEEYTADDKCLFDHSEEKEQPKKDDTDLTEGVESYIKNKSQLDIEEHLKENNTEQGEDKSKLDHSEEQLENIDTDESEEVEKNNIEDKIHLDHSKEQLDKIDIDQVEGVEQSTTADKFQPVHSDQKSKTADILLAQEAEVFDTENKLQLDHSEEYQKELTENIKCNKIESASNKDESPRLESGEKLKNEEETLSTSSTLQIRDENVVQSGQLNVANNVEHEVDAVYEYEQQNTDLSSDYQRNTGTTILEGDQNVSTKKSTRVKKRYQRKPSFKKEANHPDCSSDSSDDSSESIYDTGYYHPELYEQLAVPVLLSEVQSSLQNIEIDDTSEPKEENRDVKQETDHPRNIEESKSSYEENDSHCIPKKHKENTEVQQKKPTQDQSETTGVNDTNDFDCTSDEDLDDIDDSGQYHQELYVKPPESDCHVIVRQLEHEPENADDSHLCQSDKLANNEAEESPCTDISQVEDDNLIKLQKKFRTSKKSKTRNRGDSIHCEVSQQLEYSSDSDNNSDDIDDIGQYHPELYTQLKVSGCNRDEDQAAGIASEQNPGINIDTKQQLPEHNVCNNNENQEAESLNAVAVEPDIPDETSGLGRHLADILSSTKDNCSEVHYNRYKDKGNSEAASPQLEVVGEDIVLVEDVCETTKKSEATDTRFKSKESGSEYSSDSDSDDIDGIGQYHPELYTQLTVPGCNKDEDQAAGIANEQSPVINSDTKQHLPEQYVCISNENQEAESLNAVAVEPDIPDDTSGSGKHLADVQSSTKDNCSEVPDNRYEDKCTSEATSPKLEAVGEDIVLVEDVCETIKKSEDTDTCFKSKESGSQYSSDGDSDDIDGIGQYHPELYTQSTVPGCNKDEDQAAGIASEQSPVINSDTKQQLPEHNVCNNNENKEVESLNAVTVEPDIPEYTSGSGKHLADGQSSTKDNCSEVQYEKYEDKESNSEVVSPQLEDVGKDIVLVEDVHETSKKSDGTHNCLESTKSGPDTRSNISKPADVVLGVNDDILENLKEVEGITVEKEEIVRTEQKTFAEKAENIDRNKRIPIEVSVKINDMTRKPKKTQEVKHKSRVMNASQETTYTDITNIDTPRSGKKVEKVGSEIPLCWTVENKTQNKEKSKERKREKKQDEHVSAEIHSARPAQSEQIRDSRKNTKDKNQTDKKRYVEELTVDSERKTFVKDSDKMNKTTKETSGAQDIKKKSKAKNANPKHTDSAKKDLSCKPAEELVSSKSERLRTVQTAKTASQESEVKEKENHSKKPEKNKTTETFSEGKIGDTEQMQEVKVTEVKRTEKKAKDQDKIPSIKTETSHKSSDEHAKCESESSSHIAKKANQRKKKEKGNITANSQEHMPTESHAEDDRDQHEQPDIESKNKPQKIPEQDNGKEVENVKAESEISSSPVQEDEQIIRRRSVDISHYGEISGISAREIDNEDDKEDTVDPNVVSQKLEKWLQEKRDISIRKETERFIKGGIPEEKLQIKQRVQATSNEQRRQRSREEQEAESGYERRERSRQNSFEVQYKRSRRSSQEQVYSSPEGVYGRSRQNSQEGIYVRSRRSSYEGTYRRSRQNSAEGLYERSRHGSQEGKLTRSRHSSQEEGVKSLRDDSRLNSPEGRYSRHSQSSQDEIHERLRNRYQSEGMHERNRYSSRNEGYIRSRQNSVDLTYRHGGNSVKQDGQEYDRTEIPKRKGIHERYKLDGEEDSIDKKYTGKDEYRHSSQEDIYGFNEDQKNNRRDVFEKCRQCSHDDMYERKELSRQSSPDLIHERNDKNRRSPVFDEEFLEGRLGKKADYIEVRKFRRENKINDKKRANFLTSAHLRIFCEPKKKSEKPILGPIEMVSVSYERPKSKESERKALEKNTLVEKNTIIEEDPAYSSSLQPKTFDVYRYEKHHRRGKKSNLKFDKVDRSGDQYSGYRGQLNESGFSHKDWETCQIHNRNVSATEIGRSQLYPIDQYSKNRCAKKHDASVSTQLVTAKANQNNGEAFYLSNPDHVDAWSKYQQNLGGQKYPKNSDGPRDKSRMKIPASSGETSKDGPLSLTDTFSPMDRSQNEQNMSNPNLSGGRLSDSTTSLNNRQAPAKSPSRQNTLQKQMSIQSNQSELNGEKREDPHGIKFERLKNLEEDELMAKIKEIIGHLEKLEDYHRGDGMRIQKMLGDMYWDYTHLREMIADCMADNGYAVVSMKMLKTLNSIGIFKNDDVWFPTYYTYNTMWNFSDASSNLARTLSENDAVRLLTLNCGHKPYINALHSKNVFYVIKASLSILHNMARNSGMKHLFDENKTSETVMPFMDSEDEMLKILATLTIANIVDEEENKTVIAETGTIHCMVSWIEKAISLPRRRFKGFTPQELTEGLNKLAVNDSNKMRIVEEGAVPLFHLMLQHEDVREQSSAGRIIWTLSFDKDVRQKLIENTDLISTLEKLTESTNKSVQQNCNGALWIIKGENDISRESKPKGTPTKSHVFLSYSWSDKDTVLAIRDKLRAEGYAIWIDIEKGTGASLEGMANAIENSAVVLVCMSEKYKQNPNCRTEAEYTFQLKKDYIPLMLQKKYRPDGWLGFILGAKLYFDFSGKYPLDKSYTGLLKELRGRGQVTPNTTPLGSNETSDGAMVTSQSLTSYASPGTPVPSNSVLLSMGQEELVKWLRVVKLTECIPAFLEFDGKLLMQLKQMRVEAPEFFYQCLEKRLNMSLIEILKFTRALEELH